MFLHILTYFEIIIRTLIHPLKILHELNKSRGSLVNFIRALQELLITYSATIKKTFQARAHSQGCVTYLYILCIFYVQLIFNLNFSFRTTCLTRASFVMWTSWFNNINVVQVWSLSISCIISQEKAHFETVTWRGCKDERSNQYKSKTKMMAVGD